MSKRKGPDFMSLISKNRLEALKQKLKNKGEACPINTMNQLLQTSVALPKHGSSLLSLSSRQNKPVSSCSASTSAITNHQSENVTKVSGSDGTTDSVSEQQVEANQTPNLDNVREDLFAVPKTRPPRSLKNEPSYWIDEVTNAATLAWCIMDKESAEELFFILIFYLLKMIEDSGPETTQVKDPRHEELFLYINDWLHNQVSDCGSVIGSVKQTGNMPHPGFNDMDNFSSVSGYVPFQPGFGNQQQDRRGSMINSYLPGFNRTYDQSVVGSVHNNNHFNYEVDRHSMVNGAGLTLPSFMNVNPVGPNARSTTYHQGNESFMNQSNARTFNMPGYRSRPMSIRSDAPYVYRPLQTYHANLSTMNPGGYSQMNSVGNMRRNQTIDNNTTKMTTVSSVIQRSNRLNHTIEDRENVYNTNTGGNIAPSRRRMPSPLQPTIVLKRIEANDISVYTTRTRKKTPSKEGTINESNIVGVTRSGRSVRAPQHFWLSQTTSVSNSNCCNQTRGTKRKRV